MGQSQALVHYDGAFEPLTVPAQTALWVASATFAMQAMLHQCRGSCVTTNTRGQQHEQLAVAATGSSAVLYLGMASGCSKELYVANNSRYRIYFQLLYLVRGFGLGLVFLNLATLARERRPPAVALGTMWLTSTVALYLGNFVAGGRRLALLFASIACLLPVATTLVCSMGERVHMSQLQLVHKFLATWCLVCCACYALTYFLCEVAFLLDTETEIMIYVLLDLCAIGVSSLVICCAGRDLEAGLLPAQEAELSLYPGPHNYGFYPNPDFYNDNL